MHGDVDDARQDLKYLVLCLLSLLILDVLVPEGMGKKIEAYKGCRSLEEPVACQLRHKRRSGIGTGWEERKYKKRGLCANNYPGQINQTAARHGIAT